MHRNLFRLVPSALALFALVAPRPALAQPYTLTDLGSLGGSSYARSINNAGQVVGTAWSATFQSGRAFGWSPTTKNGTVGVMQDLGALSGHTTSQANGINDAGQVVGSSSNPATGITHAFLYSTGVMKDLGTLAGR